jgi:hypothetical protein
MSDQSGPPDTRPPSKPPSGPPPKLALPVPSHAGHQPPVYRDPMDSRSQRTRAVATTGEPGFTFTEGEHRLVGHVGPPAEAEAELLAALIVAASGKNPRPQARPRNARPYGPQPLNPATPYRKP